MTDTLVTLCVANRIDSEAKLTSIIEFPFSALPESYFSSDITALFHVGSPCKLSQFPPQQDCYSLFVFKI